mmetsp:Transcript_63979/g.171947  ORF Transcript_63979/g.171947 Transcript_63979/m.171947 type:complete len:138 (+) Transcript_63979:2-415(+)
MTMTPQQIGEMNPQQLAQMQMMMQAQMQMMMQAMGAMGGGGMMPGQHMQQQQQQMLFAPAGQATCFPGGEQPCQPSHGAAHFNDLVTAFHQKGSINSSAPAAYSVGPAGGGAIPPAPMPHAAPSSGCASGNPFDMFG